MALSFILDHAQKRKATDWVFVTAAGDELIGETDGAPFSNTWVDPVTNTLMLAPTCVEEAWDTSNSGDFVKLGSAAFTFGTPANWEVRQDQRGKGPWLSIKDTVVSDTAITTGTYGKNRGFTVAWFGYGAGENFPIVRCGWNSTPSATSGLAGRVTVEFYSTGKCNVYLGNTIIKTGNVTGNVDADAQAGQFFKVLLLPFRHRELLVYSFKGNGFTALFDNIASDAVSPTITPDTNFWFEVVSGGTQVQVAPVVFPSTGYAWTQKLSFAEAPATGATLGSFGNLAWIQSQAPAGNKTFRVWGHPAYVGNQTATVSLFEYDLTTSFVPNSIRQNVRMKVTLGTDNTGFSPFVYGVATGYRAEMADTNATEEHDATINVTACNLSVPDDPGGVMASLDIRDPEGLEADVFKFRTMANRPAKLALGAKAILDGYGDPQNYEIIHNPDAARMDYQIRDAWRVLDNHIFRDRVGLDGLNFAEAVEQVVRLGLGSTTHVTLDISTTAYALAPDPMPDSNDFAFLIEAGETAGGVLQRLLRDYAATWVYGFKPTAAGLTFFAKAPADLPSTPALTLYTTRAAATTAGKPNAVAFEIRPEVLEPEATEVRVTGFDPRDKRPIQAFKVRTTLETVTTAPSSRPAGWLGEKRPYGLVLSEIQNTQELARVTELLYDRLTVQRELIEWRSDLLLYEAPHADEGYPLWRGELVEIDGLGDYRIVSFGGDFIREASGVIVRRFTYVGEKVS